jgi:ferric-dicitrate binding protein FerR (iron transport regulator)
MSDPLKDEDAAALWAARLDRGDFTEQDREELEKWLAERPSRLGQLFRARGNFGGFPQ